MHTSHLAPAPAITTAESPALPYHVGDLSAPGAAHRLRARLATDGLALFAGVLGRERMLDLAAGLMEIVAHPDGNADGLTTLRDLGPLGDAPNAAGFSSRPLAPHTDRSGVEDPPELLMTACLRPAGRGGASVLVDGKAVHDDLSLSAPAAIAALLRPQSVRFGDAGGLWTSVLADSSEHGTEPAASPSPPRRRLRLRLDDLASFSVDVRAWLPELRAAVRRHSWAVHLQAGEGYLLDNHRWLHGRAGYRGSRVVLRLHGRPLPQLAFASGIPLASGSQPGSWARGR